MTSLLKKYIVNNAWIPQQSLHKKHRKMSRRKAAHYFTRDNYFFSSVMLKRFLKRSTRPPVSTSFCLPVKNGWHFEQISTRRSFFVDEVWMTSPQAQRTSVGSYLGWIPAFIIVTSFGLSAYNFIFKLSKRNSIIHGAKMQALFSYFLIRSDFNRRIYIKRVQKRLLDGHFERL